MNRNRSENLILLVVTKWRLDREYAELYRDHPFQEPADFVTSLRDLINRTDFKSTLELE